MLLAPPNLRRFERIRLGVVCHLRHQAEEMRDLYANANANANAIAEAIYEGREPVAWQVAAWARYRRASAANTTADVLRTITDARS